MKVDFKKGTVTVTFDKPINFDLAAVLQRFEISEPPKTRAKSSGSETRYRYYRLIDAH